MTVPKIFVTGATGFVGGDALFVIMSAHPDWHYTLFVRDVSRLGSLLTTHPSTRVVLGDLSDTDLLKSESASADIVLHFASSDDEPAAQAIVDGLRSSSSSSSPRYLIHTSGTGDLLHEDTASGNVGNLNPHIWDDVADIDAINAWPSTVFHRPVEKIALEAGDNHPHLRTAVVAPPSIIGTGRGSGNTRSIQVPSLIALIRSRGRAFQLGAGKASWSQVHVHDLSQVYLKLVEAAALHGGAGLDWGREAFYFVENGERDNASVSRTLAAALHRAGALPSDEVEVVDAAAASEMSGFMLMLTGMNSRSRATRARAKLGWVPEIDDFEAVFEEDVRKELKAETTRLQDMAAGHMPGGVPFDGPELTAAAAGGGK